jgi:hypothetical protein
LCSSVLVEFFAHIHENEAHFAFIRIPAVLGREAIHTNCDAMTSNARVRKYERGVVSCPLLLVGLSNTINANRDRKGTHCDAI